MRDISLKELLEAGCHFGHQVTRQNPRAREFIFQAREGIHIIDLAKTREDLMNAAQFVHDVAAKGGTIVFVGTKRQARGVVSDAVKRIKEKDGAGVFLVTERWIGGTLTNFEEVAKNYKKLKDLRSRLASEEERAKYTKKEVGLWDKHRQKLERFYAGICDLEKLPDAIFIVDTHKEVQAVREANRTAILVVGIVDTNADPMMVDYPIPANDDAVGSIKFITDYIAEAWMEGNKLKVPFEVTQGKQSETRSTGSGQVLKVDEEGKSGSMEEKKLEVRSKKLEVVPRIKEAVEKAKRKTKTTKKKTTKKVKKAKKS